MEDCLQGFGGCCYRIEGLQIRMGLFLKVHRGKRTFRDDVVIRVETRICIFGSAAVQFGPLIPIFHLLVQNYLSELDSEDIVALVFSLTLPS